MLPGPARGLRLAVLVFLGYYAGARLGFVLTFLPLPISVLWPPNAIVLGALLLVPVRAWWIVVLAALPAHLLSELHEGIPVAMVLSWYASNMSEALIGAGLVCAFHEGPAALSTLRGMVTFIAAACLAAIASSFLDSALVKVNGWGDVPYWELWRRRVFSNIASSLVIAPLVVAWGRASGPALRKIPVPELVEAALLAAGLVAVVLVGWSVDSTWVAPCAPLPFLLWAALRFGTRGATAAFAGIAVAAIWALARASAPSPRARRSRPRIRCRSSSCRWAPCCSASRPRARNGVARNRPSTCCATGSTTPRASRSWARWPRPSRTK